MSTIAIHIVVRAQSEFALDDSGGGALGSSAMPPIYWHNTARSNPACEAMTANGIVVPAFASIHWADGPHSCCDGLNQITALRHGQVGGLQSNVKRVLTSQRLGQCNLNMSGSKAYDLVRLRNGAWSVYSTADGETMHPGLGPLAEAESLYVQQLDLRRRIATHSGEFVVWDVGLGAAANALAVIRAVASSTVRIISFDSTVNAVSFALNHVDELKYLSGYEAQLRELIRCGEVQLPKIHWKLRLGDFVELLNSPAPLPTPHAILFDPFSPSKNPVMWTRQLFTAIFRLLQSSQLCALATYSRSTMVRTALLLSGFFVGRGRPIGLKEETTIAANTLDLIREPLDRRWLEQAERSDSAEPLTAPVYRRAPLTPSTREELRRHPQFVQT